MGVIYEDKGPVSGAAVAKEIRPNSPAEKAGMEAGMRSFRRNGQPIERIPQMKTVLGPMADGSKLDMVVKRGGKELPLSMVLAAEIPPLEYPMLGILPARTPENEGFVSIRHVSRTPLPRRPGCWRATASSRSRTAREVAQAALSSDRDPADREPQ